MAQPNTRPRMWSTALHLIRNRNCLPFHEHLGSLSVFWWDHPCYSYFQFSVLRVFVVVWLLDIIRWKSRSELGTGIRINIRCRDCNAAKNGQFRDIGIIGTRHRTKATKQQQKHATQKTENNFYWIKHVKHIFDNIVCYYFWTR
jgi:hypothetical protein